jgi:hypothetical protein
MELEIAAEGGVGRRHAKNAARPIHQSREGHLSAWPLHSPAEGGMGWQYAHAATVARPGGRAVEHLGRDRVAAVAGVLFVVALVIGQYLAPDLVYPEEQVGGVQLTFYVNYENALLVF